MFNCLIKVTAMNLHIICKRKGYKDKKYNSNLGTLTHCLVCHIQIKCHSWKDNRTNLNLYFCNCIYFKKIWQNKRIKNILFGKRTFLPHSDSGPIFYLQASPLMEMAPSSEMRKLWLCSVNSAVIENSAIPRT